MPLFTGMMAVNWPSPTFSRETESGKGEIELLVKLSRSQSGEACENSHRQTSQSVAIQTKSAKLG